MKKYKYIGEYIPAIDYGQILECKSEDRYGVTLIINSSVSVFMTKQELKDNFQEVKEEGPKHLEWAENIVHCLELSNI